MGKGDFETSKFSFTVAGALAGAVAIVATYFTSFPADMAIAGMWGAVIGGVTGYLYSGEAKSTSKIGKSIKLLGG